MPQVEVTFDIDANGILKVTAKDKATNKSQDITITGSSNLSKDEIERMKKEAEAHAAEDRKRREVVDVRNQADTLLAVSERTLKDGGDKIADADKKSVTEKIEALKAVKDKEDLAAIKKAMDELSNAIQKVGASMYSQAQPNQQSASTGAPADKQETSNKKQDQGPVDAEYEDVPKDKK